MGVLDGGHSHSYFATIPWRQAIVDLCSNETEGLTNEEAVRRCELLGCNEFSQKESTPPYLKFLDQFKNPFIILLLISALVSFLLQQYDDCFGITLVCSTGLFGSNEC